MPPFGLYSVPRAHLRGSSGKRPSFNALDFTNGKPWEEATPTTPAKPFKKDRARVEEAEGRKPRKSKKDCHCSTQGKEAEIDIEPNTSTKVLKEAPSRKTFVCVIPNTPIPLPANVQSSKKGSKNKDKKPRNHAAKEAGAKHAKAAGASPTDSPARHVPHTPVPAPQPAPTFEESSRKKHMGMATLPYEVSNQHPLGVVAYPAWFDDPQHHSPLNRLAREEERMRLAKENGRMYIPPPNGGKLVGLRGEILSGGSRPSSPLPSDSEGKKKRKRSDEADGSDRQHLYTSREYLGKKEKKTRRKQQRNSALQVDELDKVMGSGLRNDDNWNTSLTNKDPKGKEKRKKGRSEAGMNGNDKTCFGQKDALAVQEQVQMYATAPAGSKNSSPGDKEKVTGEKKPYRLATGGSLDVDTSESPLRGSIKEKERTYIPLQGNVATQKLKSSPRLHNAWLQKLEESATSVKSGELELEQSPLTSKSSSKKGVKQTMAGAGRKVSLVTTHVLSPSYDMITPKMDVPLQQLAISNSYKARLEQEASATSCSKLQSGGPTESSCFVPTNTDASISHYDRVGKPYENPPISKRISFDSIAVHGKASPKQAKKHPSREEVSAIKFDKKFLRIQKCINFSDETEYQGAYEAWQLAHESIGTYPCLAQGSGCTPKHAKLYPASHKDVSDHNCSPTKDEAATSYVPAPISATNMQLVQRAESNGKIAETFLGMSIKSRIPVPLGVVEGTWTLTCLRYATSHHDRYAANQRMLSISSVPGTSPLTYTARLTLPPRTMPFFISPFSAPPHASFRIVPLQTSQEGYHMETIFLGNGYLRLRADLGLLLVGQSGGKAMGRVSMPVGGGVMEFLGVLKGKNVEWNDEPSKEDDEVKRECERLFGGLGERFEE